MNETIETANTAPQAPATVTEIRTWARERGIAVGQRGRLSGDVRTAFETATGRKAA
ncbi:histone-like nucleoid-structuring protein Lsr2 [Micromonospora sp. WMMD1082]|uniref:Lsr2 family DNA-binding protein n=1 Tax=Micromonospora sp. WMMD1082 TaxID=3016104 RepID=UPI0024172BC6|nr:histone-like nucleoid-structuring protein Lsr2 [Micromonospora sp. WMMD1082]MDG4792724.1 Lsr2 family protein [Micromonospora sp. WMMD1082]